MWVPRSERKLSHRRKELSSKGGKVVNNSNSEKKKKKKETKKKTTSSFDSVFWELVILKMNETHLAFGVGRLSHKKKELLSERNLFRFHIWKVMT